MNTSKAWDILLDELNVSEDTLNIITSINGYSLETLEDVLYTVAGYRDFEQYQEEQGV